MAINNVANSLLTPKENVDFLLTFVTKDKNSCNTQCTSIPFIFIFFQALTNSITWFP